MKREDSKPYNPLDKRNLGGSVAEALLETVAYNLPPEPFVGAGVYALYYTGALPAYSELSKANKDGLLRCPVYIGKAVPAGARKGGTDFEIEKSKALYNRLREHTDSIKAAQNLNISDFFCRFLVVDDIWIPLAEAMLIERFKPIWNCVLDGFGNHDPGKGRHLGTIPQWDCMHPGRVWAERLQECPIKKEQLENRIIEYLHEFFSRNDKD